MPRKKAPKELVPLLRGSVNIFVNHPIVLLPFVTIAFIQLLTLEILYFAPRFPLSGFFNPIVRTLWGEGFIHYPNNFIVLPKLFQYAQVPIYIFLSGYFIAVAITVIASINDEKKVRYGQFCRDVFSQYVHLFVAALISFSVFYGLHKAYSLMALRAMQITSTTGIFFVVRTVIIRGAPYFNLLIGVFVTTILAFVFPLIVIERKKVFPAFWANFKHLWGSFWFVLFLVFLPTLLYLPILLFRNNIGAVTQTAFPEARALVLVVSIVATMFIDAVIYTAITTYYLLKKEDS